MNFAQSRGSLSRSVSESGGVTRPGSRASNVDCATVSQQWSNSQNIGSYKEVVVRVLDEVRALSERCNSLPAKRHGQPKQSQIRPEKPWKKSLLSRLSPASPSSRQGLLSASNPNLHGRPSAPSQRRSPLLHPVRLGGGRINHRPHNPKSQRPSSPVPVIEKWRNQLVQGILVHYI